MMFTVYGLVWIAGVGRPAMPTGYTWATIPAEFLVQLVITTLFALGEEIGFRAYLLPRLMHLGATRALLLSGLLHGLWHFPLMLLTWYFPIHGSWLVIGPTTTLTLVAAGVYYGYLQITSGSVWPATLAHGTINTLLNFFKMFTITSSPVALEYLAGETGVLTLLVTSLMAGALLYRLRQRRVTLAIPLPAGA